ncbi:MAG: hypothetical protein LUE99_00685 [Bacteroides sp.]|nr:hypothetical protein [Bacteroides sp.]
MNKKKLLQTMFALSTTVILTTGCSNEINLQGETQGNGEPSVSFTLGLPQGDEVGYTRADRNDDATEWTIKTLKAYHFSGASSAFADADYKLVAAYDVPVKETLATGETSMGVCLKNGDAAYTLKLSLRSIVDDSKHAFAFIANDSCATFDGALEKGMTTLADLKTCIAGKKLENGSSANSTLFMGDPAGLCMTGEVKPANALTVGENTLGSVTMTRIMARMDVQNFIPTDRNFKLLSVRLVYNSTWGAPQGYLFSGQADNIWSTTEAMEITQNPQYDTNGYLPYKTEGYPMSEAWVGQANLDGRQGTWYKKVLYIYPFPLQIGATYTETPKAEVTYVLNGWTSTVTVDLKNVETGNTFAIERNTLYTLQIGETSAVGGELTFSFTNAPWALHEIDADLNEGKNN